jgi:excisionase family DNA binding protein
MTKKEDHWLLVVSVQEAAKAMGLSRATLYRLIAGGKIETIKIGARRLIRRDVIEEFLNAASVK